MINLVISARDPAAAFHLANVAKKAFNDPRFRVTLVAQSPAADIFLQKGLACHKLPPVSVKSMDSPDMKELLSLAQSLLDEFEPDVILCGLSTPFDAGIDEALLFVRDCPAYLLQDFWGEQNSIIGRGADVVFALDDEAVSLTKERHSCRVIKTGSARHTVYDELDIQMLRKNRRVQLEVGDDRSVLGLFGQALHGNSGYRRTLTTWAAAIKSLDNAFAVYRPHPRERDKDIEFTCTLFDKHGLELKVLDNSVSVEESIAACDVVASCFSNCLYDAAFMNNFSPVPLVTPMALFFDEEIVEYFRSIVNLNDFPYIKSGLVYSVYDKDDLVDALKNAIKPDVKSKYWSAARRNLLNPRNSCRDMLDIISLDQSVIKPR